MTYNRIRQADCRRALSVLRRCQSVAGQNAVLSAVDLLRYRLFIVSRRGRCQVEHERFSLCYSHYEDRHGGPGKLPEMPGVLVATRLPILRRESH